MRLGDTSSDEEQKNGWDDCDDERRLPAKVGHEGQRDAGGKNVAQREERENHPADADSAGLRRPNFGSVWRSDREFSSATYTSEETQSREGGDVRRESGQCRRHTVEQD